MKKSQEMELFNFYLRKSKVQNCNIPKTAMLGAKSNSFLQPVIYVNYKIYGCELLAKYGSNYLNTSLYPFMYLDLEVLKLANANSFSLEEGMPTS
uniref:Uncharacterized protein n=1 Tax=Megaselia scalaris TaxID=36166 RepID=T1GDJ1_MEGSC